MKRRIIIILLIVALALVGSGIAAVAFSTDMEELFHIGKWQSATGKEESKTLKTTGPVKLNVIDDLGNVSIVGADVETVQIKAIKSAYAPTQSKAEAELKTVKYDIKQEGNVVTITYKIPDAPVMLNPSRVDFVIIVPNKTEVNIENSGDVDISNIKGNVFVYDDYGDVTVENIEGSIYLTSSSGDMNALSVTAGEKDIKINSDYGRITLEKVNGKNVTIESNSGAIKLDEVYATGTIAAETDYGDVTVENSRGSISLTSGSGNMNAESISAGEKDIFISTDYGRIALENSDGKNVTLDSNSGNIKLDNVRVTESVTVTTDYGDIDLNQTYAISCDLQTDSGHIEVNGAKGKLKAYSDYGSIKVENADSVTLDLKTNSGKVEFIGSLGKGPHKIESDYGEIELTLPADSKLSVDLETEYGKIDSELPITIATKGSSDSSKDRIVGSINGGGDQLVVDAQSGDIIVHTNK